MSEDWVVVGGCVALTMQLLRLSVDMVQMASPDEKKPAKPPVEETSDKTSSGGASNAAAAVSYGSTSDNNGAGVVSAVGTTSSTASAGDEEEQAPLLQGGGNGDYREETVRWRAFRVHLLIASYSLLTLWFVSVGFIPFLLSKRNVSTAATSFNQTLLMLTASSMAMEGYLLYRDVNRKRYGSVQRVLKLSASAVLWIVYMVSWLRQQQKHAATTTTSAVSPLDLSVLAAVSIIVLLVIIDDCWSNRLPAVQRRRSSTVKKISRRALIQMLKPYFWPDSTDSSAFWNRIRAILTWVCVIGSKICGLASPLYLGWATTALAHQDYRNTIIYSIDYCVISLMSSILKEGQSLVYMKVAQAAFVQLSETAFSHLHSLSLDWHLRKKLGQVLRSMDRGIAACDTLMKYLFLWLVPALAECITVTIIFALYFNYLPLALTVFYFVFAYIFWTILVTMWRKKFRKALAQSDNEYHDIFTDSMVNFETVKFFTAEELEMRRFGDAVLRYQAGSVDMQSSLSVLNISQQVLLKACLAMALSLAAWGIKERADCCVALGCDSPISECCQNISTATCPGMQVGDFVAVLTYTVNLFAPLNFLGSVYNAIVMAMVDLSSMAELLAENPDVVDAPDALPVPKTNEKDPDIAVEFDNVVFHYPTQASSKGLKGLSFKMKRGTTTAVVGPTGAGKTTVSRLLFRFYDVLGGAVKINGVDVRSVSQQSLRRAIGVVPQSASMFNESMRYNIKYGKPDATQEELDQAARDSQLLDFILSLDDGWETLVGDRGLKLSGGERQRAAIARCLLKDPPFVLLDEATSALDTITEKSVQDALDRLGADRTVLVIAHRLGTIRNADNIIVLKDGVAAEQGTHDELLARNGIYADMWNMQLHSTSASNLSDLAG